MQEILVFSHMMKTAGTSFSKHLMGHYGDKMHHVPGGLYLDTEIYTADNLAQDINRFKNKLNIIAGHPVRPFINLDQNNIELRWFTLFRNPEKRYVSNYFHFYYWTNGFKYKAYRDMKDKSIIEWEKLKNGANYQTRFIAGEPNVNKAIDILETKFSWVGITEDLENSLFSFKQRFNLTNFYYNIEKRNRSLTDKEEIKKTIENYADFIKEKNELDNKLYDYVCKNIYPKYKLEAEPNIKQKGKSRITRELNTLRYQLHRQIKYKTEAFTLRNLKIFYTRYYKK